MVERESFNLFRPEGLFKRVWEVRLLDILDANGLRILGITRPWQVAFNGAAIPIQQATPRSEPHCAGVVEEEDRGSAAVQRASHSVQSCFVKVVWRFDAPHSVGEPIQAHDVLAFGVDAPAF